MAHTSAEFEDFFVVRWGAPTAEDCEAIKERVQAQRERCERGLVYLAIMPAELPNLDDGTRRLLMDLTEAVIPACDKLLIAMEAGGFRGAILRSAMTAVTLLTRRHDVLRVVDSVDAAVGLIAERLPADREGLAAAIEATGSPVPELVFAA